MNNFLSDKIKKIEEYIPNDTNYQIRLDANESPYKLPEDLKKRFSEIVCSIEYNRYPDPAAKALISAYASAYGLSAENIVAGNGSDELISIICTSFLSKNDRVLTVSPDFSMYAFYSGIIEADVITYNKPEKKYINFDELAKTANENNVRMVIFSNPCNPTGIAYTADVIEKFAEAVNCLCVVDEAYMEFCGNIENCSVLHKIDKHENMIVLKTLSKAFGLAALRTGFAVSCNEIIRGIKKVKSPYNVNSVSQALGTELLKSPEIISERAKMLIKATAYVYEKLIPCGEKFGFSVYKTDTNFNVLRYKNPDRAKEVFIKLAENGISVRYIMGDSLRVTCGTEQENTLFLKAISEIG